MYCGHCMGSWTVSRNLNIPRKTRKVQWNQCQPWSYETNVQHIAKLTKLDTPPLLIHCWLLKQISKQSGFCLIMENKFLLSYIVYPLRMFILNCLEQFNSTFSLSFPRTNDSMWTLCAPPPPSKFNRKIERKTLQNELERVHSVSGYFARPGKCHDSDRQQWPVLGWVASQGVSAVASAGLSRKMQNCRHQLTFWRTRNPDTSHDLLLMAIWTKTS